MLALSGAVPISAHARHRRQRLGAVGQQRRLVGGDPVEADAADEAHRRRQPDRPLDVRRAGLELVRQHVPGALLEADRGDHVAAAEERRHRVELRGGAVEHADAGRAVELVPGADVEVHAERPHVDRPVIGRLGAVDQHRGARRRAPPWRCRPPGSPCRGRSRAGDTATIRVRGGEQRWNASRSSTPRSSIGMTRSRRAGALAGHLPRHDVRVVLHRRDQHLVAGREVDLPPAVRHQVDPLGGIAGEDDLVRMGGAEERRRLGARAPRTPRWPAPTACGRRDGRWRWRSRSSGAIASRTTRGFWVVAALSR